MGRLRGTGATILAESRHLLRVRIAVGGLEAVAAVPGVWFVRVPRTAQQQGFVTEGASLVGAEANVARGVTGQGVKVAVLHPGFSGDEVHGTACAQIVHDLAPGAEMLLVRYGDFLDFGNAVDYCIDNDIDIITYSASWLASGFGDGRGRA